MTCRFETHLPGVIEYRDSACQINKRKVNRFIRKINPIYTPGYTLVRSDNEKLNSVNYRRNFASRVTVSDSRDGRYFSERGKSDGRAAVSDGRVGVDFFCNVMFAVSEIIIWRNFSVFTYLRHYNIFL